MADVLRLKAGDDIRMMKTPDAWPLGPVLCLVNEKTGDVGLLILHPNIRRMEVFNLNLHDDRLAHLLAGETGDIDSTIYSSFEQAYEHGWRVD